jgi:hypothetical protein
MVGQCNASICPLALAYPVQIVYLFSDLDFTPAETHLQDDIPIIVVAHGLTGGKVILGIIVYS